MKTFTSADALSGLLFACVGSLGIFLSLEERIGTAARMGPGYMPLVLSICLVVLGCAVLVRGLLAGGEPVALKTLRPPVMIMLSVIAFALCIRSFGLFAAVFLATCVASYAQSSPRVPEVVALALALSAFCSAVFIWGLGLTIPVFLP